MYQDTQQDTVVSPSSITKAIVNPCASRER